MIAIAGPNLPHEVLMAANCHGGPLRFDPDRPTPKALQWLESKFAPWTMCVLESWIEGAYDDFEQVLFSRADDSSQRLYYYLCELQRRGQIGGPEPLIFDVAKIPRQTSLLHTTEKVRSLAGMLGTDEGALEKAIMLANDIRANDKPLISGDAVLLVGTATPDRRLHKAIEHAGFSALGTTLVEEWTSLGAPVEVASGDPALAISRLLHSSPRGSRSFADPAKLLADDLDRFDPKAVILWRIEEDEALSWHLPSQLRLLEERGIPHLLMTRRDWQAKDGAAEEIREFLGGLSV